MLPAAIAGVVGFITSVGFEFFPGLREWYDKQQTGHKKLIMVGIGGVVVGGAYGLSCGQLFGVNVYACDWAGGQEAILAFLSYLGANQGTYALFLKKDSQPAG